MTASGRISSASAIAEPSAAPGGCGVPAANSRISRTWAGPAIGRALRGTQGVSIACSASRAKFSGPIFTAPRLKLTRRVRLFAGANQIQNRGPTVNGMAAERTPVAIAVSRVDLSLIRDPAGRSESPWATHGRSFRKGGTEGSNPLSSSGESGANLSKTPMQAQRNGATNRALITPASGKRRKGLRTWSRVFHAPW
jgi:hypothetical protein